MRTHRENQGAKKLFLNTSSSRLKDETYKSAKTSRQPSDKGIDELMRTQARTEQLQRDRARSGSAKRYSSAKKKSVSKPAPQAAVSGTNPVHPVQRTSPINQRKPRILLQKPVVEEETEEMKAKKFQFDFNIVLRTDGLDMQDFIDYEEYSKLLAQLGFVDVAREKVQEKNLQELWNMITHMPDMNNM